MNKTYSLENLLGWAWIFIGSLGFLGFLMMIPLAIDDLSTPSQLQGLGVVAFVFSVPILLLPSCSMISLGRSMQKGSSRSSSLFFSGSLFLVGILFTVWFLRTLLLIGQVDMQVMLYLLPSLFMAMISGISFAQIRKWPRIKNTE